jgi:hypothetical protein
MRFFTNENKDDRDDARDVDVQERDDHPESVQSDPVPVPQQRANSPWSSAPDNEGVAAVPIDPASATTSASSTTDDTGTHRRDDDETDRVDNDRLDTDRDETDRLDTDRLDTDRDETNRDDTDRVETNRVDEALDDRGTFDDPQVSDAAHAPSDSDSDRDADRFTDEHAGLHEDPTPPDHAVADTAPEAVAADSDAGRREDAALRDEGGFDDPKAVDPATSEPLTTDESVAPVAAAATTTDSKPGEVTAPQMTSLFGNDAQSFQERWRDVQLRFVDSPKEATAEAAKLVDEAVDKLADSLRSQKGQFGGESSEDTEKLRVELRGYRDILNRIIAL